MYIDKHNPILQMSIHRAVLTDPILDHYKYTEWYNLKVGGEVNPYLEQLSNSKVKQIESMYYNCFNSDLLYYLNYCKLSFNQATEMNFRMAKFLINEFIDNY